MQASGLSAHLAALDAPISAVLGMIPRSVYCPATDTGVKKKGKKDDEVPAIEATGRRGKRARAVAKRAEAKVAKGGAETGGELQKKLAEKVGALRMARKADDPVAKGKVEWRKRKRDEVEALGEKEKKKVKRKDREVKGKKKKAEEREKNEKDREESGGEEEGEESGDDMEVAGVEAGDRRRERQALKKKMIQERARSGRKLTKLDVLERELKEVDKTQEEKKGDEVDEEGEKAKEMEKALVRAGGGTVKDDAKKIRKTIRKEKRKKEKSRENWEARKAGVEEDKEKRAVLKEERLKERRENKGKKSAGKGKSKDVKGFKRR